MILMEESAMESPQYEIFNFNLAYNKLFRFINFTFVASIHYYLASL